MPFVYVGDEYKLFLIYKCGYIYSFACLLFDCGPQCRVIDVRQHTLNVVGIRRVDGLLVPDLESHLFDESFDLFQVQFDGKVRSAIFPMPQQRTVSMKKQVMIASH